MQPTIKPAGRQRVQTRMIAALTTLSRLAARTSIQDFRSPGTVEYWTAELLKHLLALCEAQEGAIFVARGRPTSAATAVLEPDAWSLLTRSQMPEAEAYAALRPFLSAPDALQCSTASPATLCWKHALPLVNDLDHAHTQASQPAFVAFVVRWSATRLHTQEEEAQQQALSVLPVLTDLVETILMHLFASRAEETPQVEVLPADLLATVGHELRGPLTTIQGYAETLLRYEPQLTPVERQDFLRAISQASVHAGALVNRFLELAQFETQKLAFVPVPVNMQALTQEAITAAQALPSHRLHLLPAVSAEPSTASNPSPEKRLEEDLTIEGDRRLLRTMLDTLLENALAYSTPESLVELSLTPRAFTATAGVAPPGASSKPLALILPAAFQNQEPLLEIRVRDHGRGIAPEHLTAIFRRFYRVDTRLTREVNGLGLGLTLCQAIVAQHRGMLWVESVLGEGSTFHILLPRGTRAREA